LFNAEGKAQLQGYINALRLQPNKYPNPVAGTAFNPDKITLPFNLVPSRTLKIYTDYDRDPGMIYYIIVHNKFVFLANFCPATK
jgi:hypothetical protein